MQGEREQECYRIGAVMLHAGTQEVHKGGELIPLPPLSFNLLLTLARHAPNVVTARQLEEEVWSGLVVDRGTINKRVLLVRQALREAGCEEPYITVVRGTGYRLTAPVERVIVEPREPVRHTMPHATDEAIPELPSLNMKSLSLIGVALLAVALAWKFTPEATDTANGLQTSVSGVPLDPEAVTLSRSLAVLPFKEPDAGTTESFLGQGIAREIGDLLATRSDLQVASSRSASALLDQDAPLSQIGASLGVGTVLSGSVHHHNDQIHVAVELTDVDSGYVLWSRHFERPMTDVFAIQDDIVTGVAATLKAAMDVDRPGTNPLEQGDVEAFTLFLQGRALLDLRIERGVPAIREALGLFQQAAQEDPEFVRARVGIASAEFLLPAYDPLLPADTHLARAEAAARYALELDPDSTEAMGVLAAIMVRRGVPVQAAAMFNRTQELGTTDPNIVHWHAMLFTSMGYFTDLLPILEEAYRLDPMNPLLGCSLASAFHLSGHPEQAARVLRDLKPFSRRDIGLALASLYVGDYDTARELLRGVEMREGIMPAEFADTFVDAFEFPLQHEGSVEAFVRGAHDERIEPLVAFEALVLMGSPRAFDLEVDLRGTHFEHNLPEGAWNNWGVALRRDPRFKNWVKSLGYDQYWRAHQWPDRCKPTRLDDFECI